jgi:hypothetical protein
MPSGAAVAALAGIVYVDSESTVCLGQGGHAG